MVSISVLQNPSWTMEAGPGETNRHRPGDTYVIGGKPADPLDPGPWLWNAPPTYRRDTRTGRHRRGELPDPFPRRIEPPQPRPGIREEAWERFVEYSAPLAEAHLKASRSERTWGFLLLVLRWLYSLIIARPRTVLKAPPQRPSPRPGGGRCPTRRAGRSIGRAAVGSTKT